MNWREVEENNACDAAYGGRKRAGELVTKDMEKAEVFNAFFASFFTDKTGLQESWGFQGKRKIWNRKYSPSVEKVQVWEHLNKLDITKSMGAGGVLRDKCWGKRSMPF